MFNHNDASRVTLRQIIDASRARAVYRKEHENGKKSLITQAIVTEAIKAFKSQGGIIERLPDEPETIHNRIGSNYSVYEDPFRHDGWKAPRLDSDDMDDGLYYSSLKRDVVSQGA